MTGKLHTLARAKYLLNPDKPMDVTGGFRFAVGRENFAIYGATKKSVGGGTTIYYTLKSPSGTIYNKDWAFIVAEALKEAHELETNVPLGSSRMLREGEKYRYEALLDALKEAAETGGVLKLLNAVSNLTPQAIPALKKLIQVVSLVDESMDKLLEATKSGLQFLSFVAQRPYVGLSQIMVVIEEVLPGLDKLPSNQEIIDGFLTAYKRGHRLKTRAQYILKLKKLNEYLDGKPFLLTRSDDINKHIANETIKEGPAGDNVAAGTNGNIISQLRSFFNYLARVNLYPKIIPNPVPPVTVKKKTMGAKPHQIISGEKAQLWFDVSRWEDFPWVVSSVKEAIRSETIELLFWEDFKWDEKFVDVYPLISKVGQAWPVLGPEVLEMLEPYRHCKGPVVPQRCTPERARSQAKQAGVVEGNFANHGRKTAISHRGTELELQGMKEGAVVTQLEHENGHSKQVSDTWYRYRTNAAQVASWRAAKRIMPETVISVYQARLYFTTQLTGYVRVKMEILQRNLVWNAETAPKVIETLMLRQLEEAKKYFADGPSLPTFIKIAGPDLSSDRVREITDAFSTPSIFGLYCVVVSEADCTPRLAQVRLLDLMDRLREHNLVLIMTSNDELPDFDARFLSRTKPQLFTAQGLAPLARDWLSRIAAAEGIPLSKSEAARIVKISHNNLRACLQSLELLGAERKSVVIPAPQLPDILPPQDTLPTTGNPAANPRQTAEF